MLLSYIKSYKFVILICLFYIFAYCTLGVVRHNHFGSYGYDLGIDDQIVWKYSQFHLPITTIDDTPYSFSLTNHIELIYAFAAPFYWVWNDVRMLIILQTVVTVTSAIPVFLLARKYKLKSSLCYTLFIGYLTFYGVQQALWFDVHSTPFGASFLMWLIYFLDMDNYKGVLGMLVLTVISKENFSLLAFLVCVIYFVMRRKKVYVIFAGIALAYLLFIFFIYFPMFVPGGYHYQAHKGLLSQINWQDLYNSHEKREVFMYSLLSFGFIPILSPLFLVPVVASLASYFILGREVLTAQGLFLQYRIELTPLLALGTIITLARYSWLNKKYVAVYLLICIVFTQYALHLPLSYLVKNWFWRVPPSEGTIERMIAIIPKDAAVVSQNNITPHLSHRDHIFTLWPQVEKNPACPRSRCAWFSWGGEPSYMIVDISSYWDIRHFLAHREAYVDGLTNLERAGYIKKYRQDKTTILYKIIKHA